MSIVLRATLAALVAAQPPSQAVQAEFQAQVPAWTAPTRVGLIARTTNEEAQ